MPDHQLAEFVTTPICGKRLRMVLVDSGFRPGKPIELPQNRVYTFCQRFPRFVWPTKGVSRTLRATITKSRVESTPIGETAKRGLELLHLDTDHFKTRVFEKVRWPAGEPGSWYLPSDIEDRYCKQVVSEAKMRLASGKTRWVERSKEIHLLDLEAMQMAAAEMLNVQRISGAVRQQPAPPASEEAETGPEIAPSARPPPQQRDQDDPNAVFHSLFQEAQRPHNWVRDGGPLRPGSWLGRGR